MTEKQQTKTPFPAIDEREKAYQASLWGNLALAAFKIAVGMFGFSRLLLADGLQSGANSVVACVTLMGIKIAEKPADEEHMYGHGKALFMLCAVSGLLAVIAAIVLLVVSATSIKLGYTYQAQTIGLFASTVSIFGNILLYFYLSRSANALGSSSLLRSAKNNRVGIFSSTAVFAGILGAMYGFYTVEQICAVTIALILFWSGMGIFEKSVEGAMDKSVPQKTSEIKHLAASFEEVRSVDEVRIRHAGDKCIVEVNIKLDPEMRIKRACDISEKLKKTILSRIKTIENVSVSFTALTLVLAGNLIKGGMA